MQNESHKKHTHKPMRKKSFKGNLMNSVGEKWLLPALKPELIVSISNRVFVITLLHTVRTVHVQFFKLFLLMWLVEKSMQYHDHKADHLL